MGLSCRCEFDDYGDYAWYYTPPNDYSELNTSRRKRCTSCGTLIDFGATIAEFFRNRPPRHEIEENIYGDSVDLASFYLCECCADMYFSLSELGFNCISPDENMSDLVKQYNKGQYGDDYE